MSDDAARDDKDRAPEKGPEATLLDRFDPALLKGLNAIIRIAVRLLAILMVLVILMGVVDVGWTLYQKLVTPPVYILTISDMLATFGAFMAVLIAIARKVIILDLDTVDASYLWGIALIVLTMSIAYLIVQKASDSDEVH